MRTAALLLAGLVAAGVVYMRRWNRQLEAAVALPAPLDEIQQLPGEALDKLAPEPRHVIVRLPRRAMTDTRKIPPRYWS